MPFTPPASLEDAVARLIEGNRRYVEEHPAAPVVSAQRVELASGQSPFATILGCSDSRVPIEAIFDQQPGNLFVVRVAGNVVNDDGLASIEYAITVLNSMLVVVLGHEQCGAVKAALDYVETHVRLPGHMQRLAEAIAPAARATHDTHGDWWHDAVIENARLHALEITQRSTIVADAVRQGRIRVMGATYDLHSGIVTFLDEGKIPVELREGQDARDVAAARSKYL